MAHYAKIKNGVVTQVIVAEVDFFETFVDDTPGKWLQTSYNTKGGVHYQADGVTPSSDQTKAFRKNYAGVGYSYDKNRDAFIPPKPYESWILNEESCLWESPVEKPNDNNYYEWNETNQQWDLVE